MIKQYDTSLIEPEPDGDRDKQFAPVKELEEVQYYDLNISPGVQCFVNSAQQL